VTEHGLLVVLAGPSGVGKGTVHRRLRDELADVELSVSVTTRPPRVGEVDGVDYHFVDRPTFESMAEDGRLLEWAEYAGNLYGTPLVPVEQAVAAGRVVLLEIEVQGALQVIDRVPEALTVFLVPPSWEELERRLRARGTEDEETVARRLRTARRELGCRDDFDAVVINDDLGRCVAEVRALIERARTSPAT
jgi:guanylate kinase